MFGSDWLANLFLSFFLFGLIFTVASLALGWVGGAAGGHDVHVDLPGGHDVHIDVGDVSAHAGHAHQAGPGWLNLPTIMATVTWFGGVGYLLRQSLGLYGWLAALLALISGLVGGALMFLLLARVLWPMMSKPLDQRNYSLPGTSARVVSAIRKGGVGEIVYSKDGARFTAGARSDDNSAIAKGAEVVIIRYERGLAYVQDIAALLERREVG
jgi:membrane protein implicated in regulation of membrane protease activity